jgi:TonB family protein
MGSSIAFAVASAALAIQSAAIPPVPAPLKPSSPWNVEYADNMCLLQRYFGGKEQPVTLGFKPGLFSEHMRVVLVRHASETRIVRGEAQISFDGSPPIKAPFAEGFIKDKGVRAMAIDFKEPDLAPLNNAKQIRIQAGKLDIALAPNAVSAAMKALEACEKDLLVTWGMDPAAVASIASFPKVRGGIVGVFSYNDYPMAAIRNEEQGTAGVRFWVGKDGKARDCEVVESSGSALLDDQTCSIIVQRGRFEPARTSSGEPVVSIGFQRIRWEIPNG